MQNLYMRRKAQKELQRGVMPELLPSLSNYETETNKETYSTPTQLVRWAMRKNLPNNRQAATTAATSKYKASKSKSEESLQMSTFSFERPAPLTGFKSFSTFTQRKPLSMSLLIQVIKYKARLFTILASINNQQSMPKLLPTFSHKESPKLSDVMYRSGK